MSMTPYHVSGGPGRVSCFGQWDMSRYDTAEAWMCLQGSSCHLVLRVFPVRRSCPGLATDPSMIAGAAATQSQVWNQAQLT